MLVNICCSGSSGSTFLSTILNRHPDLACADELGLFSKPVLYNDFDYFKRKSLFIRSLGISSNPYFTDASILRNLESYQLKRSTVWSWVKESRNICDLADKFHQYVLKLTSKKIWIEKTPENIYLISQFIKTFPGAKIIHIVRDPRDVIMSKLGRGAPLEFAAERWLTSVAAIQNYRDHKNVHEVRYEDLILNSKQTLKNICAFLGINFNMDYFIKDTYKSKGLERKNQWDSWLLKPSEGFSSKSIGKFKDSGINFKPVLSMKLSKEYAALLNVEEYSLVDLANNYQYDLSDEPFNQCKGRAIQHNRLLTLKKRLGKRIRRTFIGYEHHFPRAVY